MNVAAIDVIEHVAGTWDVVYDGGRVNGFSDVQLAKEFLSHFLGRTVHHVHRGEYDSKTRATHWYVSEALSFKADPFAQTARRNPVHGVHQANTTGLTG